MLTSSFRIVFKPRAERKKLVVPQIDEGSANGFTDHDGRFILAAELFPGDYKDDALEYDILREGALLKYRESVARKFKLRLDQVPQAYAELTSDKFIDALRKRRFYLNALRDKTNVPTGASFLSLVTACKYFYFISPSASESEVYEILSSSP